MAVVLSLMAGSFGTAFAAAAPKVNAEAAMVYLATTDEIIWLGKFIVSKFDYQNLINDFKAIFENVSNVDWDVDKDPVSDSEITYDEGNISRKDLARVRCLYNPDPPKQYRRSPNTLSTGGYTYTAVTR